MISFFCRENHVLFFIEFLHPGVVFVVSTMLKLCSSCLTLFNHMQWQFDHICILSARNADNSDVTILPAISISILPAGLTQSLVDTVGRRGRRDRPSRCWLNLAALPVDGGTDPPGGLAGADAEVEVAAWCVLEQLQKVKVIIDVNTFQCCDRMIVET